MATSPTVLVNGSSSASASAINHLGAAGFPFVRLMLVVVASVILTTFLTAGGMYYLARSGRLPGTGNVAHKPEVVASAPTTHVMVMEPLLVNLMDSGGSAYLKVAVALRVADGSTKKASSSNEQEATNNKSTGEAIAPIRDTLLAVLSTQTADELLAAGGKERLKAAMKSALTEHNPEVKVQNVFFTDFLVQR